MKDIISMNQQLTMSSLEISKLTDKRHDHVMRDIANIIKELNQNPNLGADYNFNKLSYHAGTGKEYPMYLMDKPATLLLTTGYSIKQRAQLIKRWQELESQSNHGYLPQSLPEALRAYANEVEDKEKAQLERDAAIQTKAYINNKKTATAMATASVLSRENKRLKNELGEGEQFKTVKGISWLLDYFNNTKPMYSVVGRQLSKISKNYAYSVNNIESTEYGSINTYHVEAIDIFKDKLDGDLNFLNQYRKQ